MRQEFDKKKLDLDKQKEFNAYPYMTDFDKFKEKLLHKEKFYSSYTGKKINDKEYEHVLKAWNKFKTKMMKDYHNFYLKSLMT